MNTRSRKQGAQSLTRFLPIEIGRQMRNLTLAGVFAGMPIGSPGMQGADPEPYEVMTFTQGGATDVYERVRPQ